MTTYRLRSDGLRWREIAGEAVVVDLPSSRYLSANPSGTLLWSELERGATRERLAALLVERYGIDAERAGADVDRFLASLESRDLLDVDGRA